MFYRFVSSIYYMFRDIVANNIRKKIFIPIILIKIFLFIEFMETNIFWKSSDISISCIVHAIDDEQYDLNPPHR